MAAIDHYPVKFRSPGKPVNGDVVTDCERTLNVVFPMYYVDFLLVHNGGAPSPAYLPFPGSADKVKRFYSIGVPELVENCLRLRAAHGLPEKFIPIAELDGRESYLLLRCSAESAGTLLYWFDLKNGFRHLNEEYSNAVSLYFGIEQLFFKFGPAKNRKDRDGMFCELYYASANPQQGKKLATKFAAEGYDLNFVLPTFRHPIFGAIDSDAFQVAATLLSLGVHLNHLDPRHNNATIEQRLLEAQQHWARMLVITRGNNYDNGISMATRRLADIELALHTIQQRCK